MQYSNPNLPSNLYTNGAVNFDTRQLAQNLMLEQRQRLARQQEEDKQLNAITKGALGGVFAPDQGDAVAKYDNWRKLQKAVLFDKKLHHDRKAYAEAQTKRDAAFQEFMEFTAKSKARNDFFKGAQGIKPDERSETFGQDMQAYAKTPMLKLDDRLSNPDTYRDMNNYYDANKLHSAAIGKEVESEFDGEPAAPDSMMKKVNVYTRREFNPAQMENTYFNAASEKGGAKYLRSQAKLLTPEAMHEIDQQIENIPADVWKVVGGKPDLSVKHPDLPESIAANYLAKKSFLDNLPKLKSTKDVLDYDKQRKFKQEDEKKMALFKHGLDKDEIAYRATVEAAKSKEEAANGVEGYMQNLKAQAEKNNVGGSFYDVKNGQKINEQKFKKIPVTSTLAKAFEKVDKNGDKVQPNELGMDDKGNFYPIYWERIVTGDKDKKGNIIEGTQRYEYKRDSKTGDYFRDKSLSQPTDWVSTKAEIANAFLTPKMVEANMPSDPNAKPKSTPATKTKKTVSIKLKTGSLDNL